MSTTCLPGFYPKTPAPKTDSSFLFEFTLQEEKKRPDLLPVKMGCGLGGEYIEGDKREGVAEVELRRVR